MPATPAFDAIAAVAAIRATGQAADTELDVQPIRDAQITDLRAQASALEAKHAYKAAAQLLDQALALSPDDPALLQERAETALLLRAFDEAGQYATRAWQGGSKVGPLCRRHWETIAQVRTAKPPAATATTSPESTVAEARRARDACTVNAPPRY